MYLKRNDSAVIDAFGGQFKSKLKCNECELESFQFDPFLSVAVSIPPKPLTRTVVLFESESKYAPLGHTTLSLGSTSGSLTAGDIARWVVAAAVAEKNGADLPESKNASGFAGIPDPPVKAVVALLWRPAETTYCKTSRFVRVLSETDNIEQAIAAFDKTVYTAANEYAHPSTLVGVYLVDQVDGTATQAGGATNATSCSAIADPSSYIFVHTYTSVTTYNNRVEYTYVYDARIVAVTEGATQADIFAAVQDCLMNLAFDTSQGPSFEKLPSHEIKFLETSSPALSGADISRIKAVKFSDLPSLVPSTEVFAYDARTAHVCTLLNSGINLRSNPRQINRLWLNKQKSLAAKAGGLSLETCFKNDLGRTEQLGENDMWYCPRCKEHRRAFKTIDLWRAPRCLTVQIKRFSKQEGGWGLAQKDSTPVEYPVVGLDLSEYVTGPAKHQMDASCVGSSSGGGVGIMRSAGGGVGAVGPPRPLYDLYAVSEHSGGTAGGHYTAIIKCPITGRWVHANDSTVSPVTTEANLQSRDAYVLFYMRRDPDAPPPAFHGAGSGGKLLASLSSSQADSTMEPEDPRNDIYGRELYP